MHREKGNETHTAPHFPHLCMCRVFFVCTQLHAYTSARIACFARITHGCTRLKREDNSVQLGGVQKRLDQEKETHSTLSPVSTPVHLYPSDISTRDFLENRPASQTTTTTPITIGTTLSTSSYRSFDGTLYSVFLLLKNNLTKSSFFFGEYQTTYMPLNVKYDIS